jgi:TetR/AcrR family transcriptional regulator, repressor for neighboring sulfatase
VGVIHQKPQGKTAVMAAVLDAAALLIAERGTRSVTLRDIALKANVNHGLIIRHFGSKERLIEAVGLSLVNAIIEETGARNATLLETLANWDNRYSVNIRAIVRIMLDDPEGYLPVDTKPLIDRLLDRVKAEQKKLHIGGAGSSIVLVFVIACVVFGDEVFGPYLRKAMAISEESYRRLRPRIFQAIISGLHPSPQKKVRGRRQPRARG